MAKKGEEIMPDTFIVTISSAAGDFEADMELPAGLPISDMRSKILDILKAMDKERFATWQSCRLRYKNRFLMDTETLLRAGAFDGSRLAVAEG